MAITDREQRRLDRIARDINSRVKVAKEDAQWALDLAKREGARLLPITVKTAAAHGFNVQGIKTTKDR